MIYILTALKSEAQAFVDKYKLKKKKIGNYSIYTNENIFLLISGIGILKAIESSEFLITNFQIDKNDTIINIGICGATPKYEIGKLLQIQDINYNQQNYKLSSCTGYTLTCIDYEATTDFYEIVDMESYGFYKIFHKYNLYIFKVVSDYFEPDTITKEGTKTLIFNTIDELFKKAI